MAKSTKLRRFISINREKRKNVLPYGVRYGILYYIVDYGGRMAGEWRESGGRAAKPKAEGANRMNEALLEECRRYVQSGGGACGAVLREISLPFCEMMEADTGAAEQYLRQHREDGFTERLLALIDRTGQKDSEVYKKAGIDRRLFSKIRSRQHYVPSKRTVMALCLALELSREEADGLLSAAGYSLSRADDLDLIVAFCLERKLFDRWEVNEVLAHFGYEPF